jgi:hypothetical protein
MSSSQQSSANAARTGLPPALTQEVTADYISYLKWVVTNLLYFVILLPTVPIILIYCLDVITLKIFLALEMCSIISTLLGVALFLVFSSKIRRTNNPWLRFCIQIWCLIFPSVIFILILLLVCWKFVSWDKLKV